MRTLDSPQTRMHLKLSPSDREQTSFISQLSSFLQLQILLTYYKHHNSTQLDSIPRRITPTHQEIIMSSVFDQYFQQFLGDESNEFDIFRGDDFDGEPEGIHHSDDGKLEDRAVSSTDFSSAPSAPTFGIAKPDLVGEMSLPENDARAG